MKIISLINEFTNSFNESFKQNLNPLNLENKIRDVGDNFTLKLYESFLNYLDDKFKNSKERKNNYNIKETRQRTLLASIGYITINSTSYYHKETKERFRSQLAAKSKEGSVDGTRHSRRRTDI